jgi:hypothetical protein
MWSCWTSGPALDDTCTAPVGTLVHTPHTKAFD